MGFALTQTLTIVALVSYLIALGFEFWRPGSVTYFWNPQWLLLIAVVGMIFLGIKKDAGSGGAGWKGKNFIFFIIFAMVGVFLLWRVLPPSLTRWGLVISFLLLVILCKKLWKTASFAKL
ncbi:hypothetical protein HY628_01145 [Candidatus Uhrbacteria bacterium]|nr:hypothetical protein [Candidatus Uhrbacteria bacterium]